MNATSSKTIRWRIGLLMVLGVVGCNQLSGAAGIQISDAPAMPDVPDAAPEPAPPPPEPDVAPPAPDSATNDTRADGGPGVKYVFITQNTFAAAMGGRDGGDSRCAKAASAAGLTGTWIAWLSVTNSSAIDRIEHTGAYHLLDETEVVASKSELASGSISNPINMTEKRVKLTSNRGVWTGTRADGSVDATCGDWASVAPTDRGTLGSSQATDSGWTKGADQPLSGGPNWICDNAVSLYCFQK
jgi:hypothetical protein